MVLWSVDKNIHFSYETLISLKYKMTDEMCDEKILLKTDKNRVNGKA